MPLWTIIAVENVSQSLAWYQTLLHLPQTPPAHEDFAQLRDAQGTVLLCLHQWGAHGHPSLTSPQHAKPGNGLLLFFRIAGYTQALASAQALVTQLQEAPHRNPNTQTMEFSLHDPDGYHVTISALDP